MDDAATVHGLLAGAGLTPPEDDVVMLEQTYTMIREMVALLYAVEDACEECPAMHFRAGERRLSGTDSTERPT